MKRLSCALAGGLFVVLHGATLAGSTRPRLVAGIAIPRTPLALKAEDHIRSVEPEFLFNHSSRTYVFGALRLKALGVTYNPETAYVAALFHDLGLVPTAASRDRSFEIDGADQAAAFVKANGGTPEQARIVWNAVVMHDLGRAYQSHQSPEALLVGGGAAGDVNGVDPKLIAPELVEEVLRAYPRLAFKRRFIETATNHCRRKPTSQIGWLDVLCREIVPNADRGSVEEGIDSAPFAE